MTNDNTFVSPNAMTCLTRGTKILSVRPASRSVTSPQERSQIRLAVSTCGAPRSPLSFQAASQNFEHSESHRRPVNPALFANIQFRKKGVHGQNRTHYRTTNRTATSPFAPLFVPFVSFCEIPKHTESRGYTRGNTRKSTRKHQQTHGNTRKKRNRLPVQENGQARAQALKNGAVCPRNRKWGPNFAARRGKLAASGDEAFQKDRN